MQVAWDANLIRKVLHPDRQALGGDQESEPLVNSTL